MKRIALIFPGSLGQLERNMYVPAHMELLKRLSQKFDTTAYTLIKPDGDFKCFRYGNALVKYVNARFDDSGWKKFRELYTKIKKDHLQNPFDIFHGFRALPGGTVAVVLGKKFRKPIIVSLQGGECADIPEIQYGDMRKQPLKSLILWTCRNSDCLTALTNFQLDSLKHHGFKLNSVKIICYGAPSEFFSDFRTKEPSPPYHFIHVGHLNRVKDQKTLLRAFKIITSQVDCQLRIIGEDYLHGELQQLRQELCLQDKVEFLGHIPHKDMPKLYQWADIMLFSSLYEGQGVAVSEAAASYVPTCGTNVGLIADLASSAAISVPVGDFVALAQCTLDLLQNKKRFEEVRNNSYSWACSHDAQWTAYEFEKLYNDLT